MEIKSVLTSSSGDTVEVIYRDIDSVSELEGRPVSGVHAYCFLNDKLVIVYAEGKGLWTPPGGGDELNETPEEAVSREVAEETNMKVLKQTLIGFQDISQPSGTVTQTRSVCIVEPYGEFVSDPDDDITEIKLIDPAEYKKYFDWGVVGDHLMKRALELKSTL
jgi:ADP-ribose pyrophosphatase YjhB (NUDIX family)